MVRGSGSVSGRPVNGGAPLGKAGGGEGRCGVAWGVAERAVLEVGRCGPPYKIEEKLPTPDPILRDATTQN